MPSIYYILPPKVGTFKFVMVEVVQQDREGVGDTQVETEMMLASLNLAHLIPLFVLNG